jgi:polyhydroxyalkanoate synthesis regulator phasin
MGFFSRVFGSSSGIEKKLEELYVPILRAKGGLCESEAKSAFRDLLRAAKDKSIKEGTSKLPPNFGDMMLEAESTNEETKAMLGKKRREGVRDEDIRWWWNMHDLERRMMVEFSEAMKIFTYNVLIKSEGLSSKKAVKRLDKAFPMYGDPEDSRHFTGENRLLPSELRDRIDRYVENRMQTDPDKFRMDVQSAGTLNVLVRMEIRRGGI